MRSAVTIRDGIPGHAARLLRDGQRCQPRSTDFRINGQGEPRVFSRIAAASAQLHWPEFVTM